MGNCSPRYNAIAAWPYLRLEENFLRFLLQVKAKRFLFQNFSGGQAKAGSTSDYKYKHFSQHNNYVTKYFAPIRPEASSFYPSFYPKYRAKNRHFLPKYYPKPKYRAKIRRFLPKYYPKTAPSPVVAIAAPVIGAPLPPKNFLPVDAAHCRL